MTVVSEGEVTTLQTDRPPLGRTFSMTVVSAGYGALTAGLAYLVFLFMRTGDDSDVAASIPVFASVTAITAIVGTVSLIWVGARRRPWFWLTAAIPALLILVQNAPYVAYDIIRPIITESFLVTVVVLTGGLAIILGGITAFFEVRRGQAIWARTGRAGWVSMAVIGALLGAAITSLLAGSASAGATGVAEEPTVSGVLSVEKTAFVATNLEIENGEVLGLFIVNKDPVPHSFDIDSLDIHVQLPPNSTTAVAIEPTGPGNLDFFCGVPGHRQAGMVGTITVDA